MPTTPGSPATLDRRRSPLAQLLIAGTVGDGQAWRLAFDAARDDLPLLAHWLDDPHCPEADRAAIRQALITNTARNQLFLIVLRRCVDWFTAAGIPCRVLKGAATMQDCFAEAGQRRLGDIDLLVPKAQLAEAAALLKKYGFRPLVTSLQREALADAHVLTHDGHSHHHWPPLVGPDGVVVELHWTMGDGFAALGLPDTALWDSETPLPVGVALAWPFRIIHAALTLQTGDDSAPRALADLIGLLKPASTTQMTEVHALLAQAPGGPALLHSLAAIVPWPMPLPATQEGSLAATASRWRHRLKQLRSPAHLSLFLRLGWQAWRYTSHLATLSLPDAGAAMANPPQWQGRVTVEEVVALVGFWQRQHWIRRPSWCLQRSALLFAGLTAIGERCALVFGLDPDQPSPIGHAWVERSGAPFLEDEPLVGRMVETYRFEPPSGGVTAGD